ARHSRRLRSMLSSRRTPGQWCRRACSLAALATRFARSTLLDERPMTTVALPRPEQWDEFWTFKGFGSLSPQQPLVPAGDRLLGASGSNIFALDIFNGKQRFVARITDKFSGDPYVTTAGGVVYYMDGRKLMARRLNDGTPMDWESPLLSDVNGLVAV